MKMHAMKGNPTDQLDTSKATPLLREAIDREQTQQPVLTASTSVRVGGQWLRRYEPGALAIDDSTADP